MAKCSSCGRDLGGISFGKKLCRWCVEYEANKRGDRKDDEIQRVMPTPWKRSETLGGASFNHLFLAINVLVFLAMVGSGISLMDGPSPLQMIRWGANVSPLTFGGEPWRLLTYMFLHYGLIHIGFNMWCLWDLGALAESLYGDWTYAFMYLLCGIGGGVMSAWWHAATVSAGASGAIFGIAGALIASIKLGEFSIPGNMIRGTLKSVVVFAVYNIVFGALWSGTDNACHMGGFVTGLIFGALIAKIAPQGGANVRRVGVCLLVLLMVGGCAAMVYRSRSFVAAEQRGEDLLNQRRTDEAIVELQRAIRQRPDYAEAHFQLAHAYSLKGDKAKERAELKRVLELDPHSEAARYNLGLSFLSTDELPQARDAFNQMIKMSSDSADAHYGLGLVAATERNDMAAVQEFERAIKLDGETDVYYDLGAAYIRLKRYGDAIPALQRHQKLNDADDYDTERALAEAYRGKGMQQEANDAEKKAASLKAQ